MKRSTIYLVILLLVLLIFPFIILGILMYNSPDLSDLENKDDESALPYNIVIHATDTTIENYGYIQLTTYKGYVDEDNPVKFIADGNGFNASLQNNTIIISVDSLSDLGENNHFLSIEFPSNAKIKLINTVPDIAIRAEAGDFKALNAQSPGYTQINSCNVAGVILSDTTYVNQISISNSNIGGLKINGKGKDLRICLSNIGTLSVSGTCKSIFFNSNNIGACSWNSENQKNADINHCTIGATVNEDVISIDINDDDEADSDVTISAFSDDTSKVRAGIRIGIANDNKNRVDISDDGIEVDSEDGDHVSVSPKGIQVNRNGQSVVSIDASGIQVND